MTNILGELFPPQDDIKEINFDNPKNYFIIFEEEINTYNKISLKEEEYYKFVLFDEKIRGKYKNYTQKA